MTYGWESEFAIEREIGRGGMGCVYLARQRKLERLVAVKAFPESVVLDLALVARFRREGRILTALSHPGIVTLYDLSFEPPDPYIAMEYVEGERTLKSVIGEGVQEPARVGRLLALTASAVDHIHRQNIVHRDIKPCNVLVTREGAPKLIDLGLAIRLTDDESRLTQDGGVLGTAANMPPEQMMGDPVDGATDVYAWGLLACELLAGRFLFSSVAERPVLAVRRLAPDFPSPDWLATVVPGPWKSLIARCLDRDPRRRPVWLDPELTGLIEPSSPPVEPLLREAARGPGPKRLEVTRVIAPPVRVTVDRPMPEEGRGAGAHVRGQVGSLVAVVAVVGLLCSLGVWRQMRSSSATTIGFPAGHSIAPAASRADLRWKGSEAFVRFAPVPEAPVLIRWVEGEKTRGDRVLSPSDAVDFRPAGIVPDGASIMSIQIEGRAPIDLEKLVRADLEQLLGGLERANWAAFNRRLWLQSRRRAQSEVRKALDDTIERSLVERFCELRPLLRVHLEGRSSLVSRILSGAYAIEIERAFLARNGLEVPPYFADPLPEAYRERLMTEDRMEEVEAAIRSQPAANRTTGEIDGVGGRVSFSEARGTCMWAFRIAEDGGGRSPSLSAELGLSGPAARNAGRSRWKLSFEIPSGIDFREAHTLVRLVSSDPSTGMVLVRVNGSTDIPFCRPPHIRDRTDSGGRSRFRRVPGRYLRAGRNQLDIEIRTLPGLVEPSMMYLNYLIIYVARD